MSDRDGGYHPPPLCRCAHFYNCVFPHRIRIRLYGTLADPYAGTGTKNQKNTLVRVSQFFCGNRDLGILLRLSEIPLADAVAIMFSRPLYGTIFAIIFLGELVGLRRWIALIVGFIGMLTMVRPALRSLTVDLLQYLSPQSQAQGLRYLSVSYLEQNI